MKLKLFSIAVLIILVVGQLPMTASMAKPERQWLQSFVDRSWRVSGLVEFNGQLYAASNKQGSVIYRTNDGHNWAQASQPFFGQPP